MATPPQPIPPTHLALIQHAPTQPLVLSEIPTPHLVPGSTILRVEAAAIISYQRDIYNGTRQYPYPTPLVPGSWCIGRIIQTGPDAVKLRPSQLVLFDSFIHARDDPSLAFLSGISDGGHPGARKLMAGEWRDSSFAQYVRVPLENCHALDEARLCGPLVDGGLGYTVEQLTWLGMALVGYGGLRSIGLQAGETVIVAPATGGFGGAAALVAAAMDARVVAMGRNVDTLRRLEEMSERVRTVRTGGGGDEEVEALKKFGEADAFLDLSPPGAAESAHLKSAIRALRKGGRVSLMGGPEGDVAFPYRELVFKDVLLKAQWMYHADTARDLIKLVKSGMLRLDQVRVAGRFALEEWEMAFEVAVGMRFDEVTVMSGW